MPQRGTTDAAMAATEYIEEGFGNGEVVALVSLDVTGAFTSAWWPSILKTLRDSGCPLNLLNLTKSYFTNCVAILQTNNTTIEADITKGCPQGSCCGPGLWNIQYNTLLELNYNSRTKAIAFADDLILMTRGNTVLEAENIANVEMTKITTWANANKIQFNERKSKVLLLTKRKRKESRVLEIYLNKRRLTQVPNLKYLGIILNSKLTFRDHITYITEKCSKLIFALARSTKLNWGLGSAALKTIYTGAILPLFCTARQFGSTRLKKQATNKKLLGFKG